MKPGETTEEILRGEQRIRLEIERIVTIEATLPAVQQTVSAIRHADSAQQSQPADAHTSRG